MLPKGQPAADIDPNGLQTGDVNTRCSFQKEACSPGARFQWAELLIGDHPTCAFSSSTQGSQTACNLFSATQVLNGIDMLQHIGTRSSQQHSSSAYCARMYTTASHQHSKKGKVMYLDAVTGSVCEPPPFLEENNHFHASGVLMWDEICSTPRKFHCQAHEAC
jgi:hypothetical protein